MGPEPPQFSFCPPIKMFNLAEIKGFYLKSCCLGLSFNLFKNVMQLPWRHSPYGTVPGTLHSDGKTLFLVYTYVWQEDVANISQVPGGRRNVNPARAITW